MANPIFTGSHPFPASAGESGGAYGWDHLVYINGVALPCEPSTYEGNTAALVDSARNVSGVMVGSVIRDDVAKISMTWRYMTAADWATMNQFFLPQYGGSFINWVYFYNQNTNMWEERQMYVNDRKAGVYLKDPVTNLVRGWTDCAVNLIEV